MMHGKNDSTKSQKVRTDALSKKKSDRFVIGDRGNIIVTKNKAKDLTVNQSKLISCSIELDFS